MTSPVIDYGAPIEALEEQIRQTLLLGPRLWYESLDQGLRKAAEALLPGSVDTHLHCDPSPAGRHGDGFAAAAEASEKGMRAVVLKDHHSDMSDSAWLARRHILPPGSTCKVLGSVWLNNHVGGWNAWAVDRAVLFGARLVGGPTVAAYGQLVSAAGSTHGGAHAADRLVKTRRPPRPPAVVATLDEQGAVRAEVIECLEIIAAAGDVVLATGHLDQREASALAREAASRGVQAISLTHGLMAGFTVDQVAALCQETGARCEFVSQQLAALHEQGELLDVIRTIGVGNVHIGTDAGFHLTPGWTECYTHCLARLLAAGLTEDEVSQMAHVNGATLLSLDRPVHERDTFQA
jgi:hypothetical protein